MAVNYEIRYSNHPGDARQYDTARIRKEFLAPGIMKKDEINLVYSFNDRLIVGGCIPVNKKLTLETIDPLKSEHFLDRRELGVINVGGKGTVTVDGKNYPVNYKEALYVGMGAGEVRFESEDRFQSGTFLYQLGPGP